MLSWVARAVAMKVSQVRRCPGGVLRRSLGVVTGPVPVITVELSQTHRRTVHFVHAVEHRGVGAICIRASRERVPAASDG